MMSETMISETMISETMRTETKRTGADYLGAGAVETVVAPRGAERRPGFLGLMKFVFGAIVSLLSGMKLTLGYLLRPSTVVTQQYPENRETLKMFDRFRGQLRLVKDDNNHMNCNGCNFCEIACPNASIILTDHRNPVNNKLELERFIWRLDSCTFCNACLQACPHDALEWSGEFEAAVYDRRLLIYTLNDYSGPPVMAIKRAKKKEENVEELLATMKSCEQFGGSVPMAGVAMPGVPALDIKASGGENTKTAAGTNADSPMKDGDNVSG